jgi:hypothetical protein
MRMFACFFGAVLAVGIAGPALADCYDILGCTERNGRLDRSPLCLDL